MAGTQHDSDLDAISRRSRLNSGAYKLLETKTKVHQMKEAVLARRALVYKVPRVGHD